MRGRLRTKIYRNHTDREGGIASMMELYAGDQHRAAFQGGYLIGVIAHFYDWGFEKLSAEQKEDLA